MNSFGRNFRVSIYGESHGTGAGILIDGCPPGIPLTAEEYKNIVIQIEKSQERSELIIPFKLGDVVLLKTGDFKGMKGVLKNIDESKGVAIVNIEMLGRLTPVVVDIDKIELMS